MIDSELARRQIGGYRARQSKLRAQIAVIDSGMQHFDPVTNSSRLINTTFELRTALLEQIELLEQLVRLWQRDLPSTELEPVKAPASDEPMHCDDAAEVPGV